MPKETDNEYEPWGCMFCGETFIFCEDAEDHEALYCEKSPRVDEAWAESHMNPVNKRCATCEYSASFINKNGWYDEGFAGSGCPQRLVYESKRKFPCPAYARQLRLEGIEFDTRDFPEVVRRYYRSFGLRG